MGRSGMLLIILGVLSLVVLAMPWIGVVAAVSVIGLPIALAYWAIPAIFMVLMIAMLAAKLLPISGGSAFLLSLIIAVGILAIPPRVLNLKIHDKAQSLVSGDVDVLSMQANSRVLAYRERFNFRRKQVTCDALCLHVLLTGTAERFLVVDAEDPFSPAVPEQAGVEFRLIERGTCPATELASEQMRLRFRNVSADRSRPGNALETLKVRATEGECLVSRPGRLGDADLVISRGKVRDGSSSSRRRSFSFGLGPMFADRISIHQKLEDGDFDEIYRKTKVRYRPFGPLMVPAPEGRHGLNVDMGWWRRVASINRDSRHDDPFEWTDFLTGRLGFDLQLAGEQAKKKTLEKLDDLTGSASGPDAAEWSLISKYYERIGRGANTAMDDAEFNYALAMLRDERFPGPPNLHQLVRYVEKNRPDEIAELAGLLISRMGSAVDYDDLNVARKEQIRNYASAIRSLPDASLRPYRREMIALAGDSQIRVDGYVALTRLSAFGEQAVPTQLELIDAGLSGGKNAFRENVYQHPYLAGMIAICLAGSDAASALPRLRELAGEGRLLTHGSYGRLLFTTLVRIGETEQAVKELHDAALKNGSSEQTDSQFQRLVQRATNRRPPCHF